MAKENKDSKNKEVDEEEQPVEPPKKPKFKWIIIAVIALAVIGSGSIAGFYLMTKNDTKKPAPKPVVISVWPMEPFVVNIAETNGERYLKIVIQLETSDPEVGAELEKIKPRIRDSILDLLTPKTYKDLIDLASKQRLREDIAGRVNNILERGKVTRVYITDFVIQ